MTTRLAFAVFLASSFLIFVVFAYIGLSTRKPRDVDHGAASRLRKLFFLSLSAILLAFLALTLPRMPYPAEVGPPDRIVHVTGKQYAFALSLTPVASLESWEEGTYPTVVEVPASSTVDFRVTSLDVNHSFGLYAADGELLAQTQAMPGYVNRLRVRFDRPGTYTVLCLEFCGLGHHRMRGVVEVR